METEIKEFTPGLPPVYFDIQLEEGAVMPTRAHETDVGYDICAKDVEFIHEELPWWKKMLCIKPRIITVKCDTGVHISPRSKSFWIMGLPNSRVSKLPFVLGNSAGVIDPDYTGSIKFIYNVLPYHKDYTTQYVKGFFSKGKVIGQLVVMHRYGMDFNQVDDLEDTERGDGGFGSTEKKSTEKKRKEKKK